MSDKTIQFSGEQNPEDFKNPEAICELVPTPVIVFSKKDAERAAEICPIKPVKDHENLIAVTVILPPEELSKGRCIMIVTHHTQGMRNGKPKSRVRGSWQIPLPIKLHNKDDRHVFEVMSREEVEKMTQLAEAAKAARSKRDSDGLKLMPQVSPDDLTGGPQVTI